MMLIDASCPSNRLEAVTNRTGSTGTWSIGAPSSCGFQVLRILGRPSISVHGTGGRIRSRRRPVIDLARAGSSGDGIDDHSLVRAGLPVRHRGHLPNTFSLVAGPR
jgi:hypothetical protein